MFLTIASSFSRCDGYKAPASVTRDVVDDRKTSMLHYERDSTCRGAESAWRRTEERKYQPRLAAYGPVRNVHKSCASVLPQTNFCYGSSLADRPSFVE